MVDACSFTMFGRNSLLALVLCCGLVAICYLFVDRPVAYFVHDHGFGRFDALRDLTLPPPILQSWSPAVLTLLVIRRMWGPFKRIELTLLIAAVAMIVADQFRESLAFVFGRTWPETWIDKNPSLLRDNVYGFHPFHGGEAYGSFPSGHMARTLALVAVFWVAYPRFSWLGVAASLAVAIGLLGMNYHFVSDVIAGSFVGGLVGASAAHLVKLNEMASVVT